MHPNIRNHSRNKSNRARSSAAYPRQVSLLTLPLGSTYGVFSPYLQPLPSCTGLAKTLSIGHSRLHGYLQHPAPLNLEARALPSKPLGGIKHDRICNICTPPAHHVDIVSGTEMPNAAEDRLPALNEEPWHLVPPLGALTPYFAGHFMKTSSMSSRAEP